MPPTKHDNRLAFRIHPKLKAQVLKICATHGVTQSEFLQHATILMLAAFGPRPAISWYERSAHPIAKLSTKAPIVEGWHKLLPAKDVKDAQENRRY